MKINFSTHRPALVRLARGSDGPPPARARSPIRCEFGGVTLALTLVEARELAIGLVDAIGAVERKQQP